MPREIVLFIPHNSPVTPLSITQFSPEDTRYRGQEMEPKMT